MGVLRRDEVALFLRNVGDSRKRAVKEAEPLQNQPDSRLAPSGVYRKGSPSPASSHQPHAREAAPAIDGTRIGQDPLELACELLERERAKYVDLFDNAPEAYVTTNLRGDITEANNRAEALFSASPGALEGRPLITFVARQDTRAFREHLHHLMEGREVAPVTLRMRPRGGDVFAAAIGVRVLNGVGGKRVAFRWILHRVELEATTDSWLEEIASLSAANDTAHDVLDLVQHVERAVRNVHTHAATRGVTVVLDSERSTWRVRSEATRLQRLLDILLAGVVAATRDRGEVRVRLVAIGGNAELDATPCAGHARAPTLRVRLAPLA